MVSVDYSRPRHGRMALRLIVPTVEEVLLPVSNAGATPRFDATLPVNSLARQLVVDEGVFDHD